MSVQIKDHGTHKLANVSNPTSEYELQQEIFCAFIFPGGMDKTKQLPNGGYRRCYQINNLGRGYINVTLLSDDPEILNTLKSGEPVKASIQRILKHTPNGNGGFHKNTVIWAYIHANQEEKRTGSVKFTSKEKPDSEKMFPCGFVTMKEF